MVDEIITRQQLVDASVDAESLQKFIGGTDIEDVLTRLGQIYPTLAKLVRILMETGGWKAYQTEAALLATTPTVNPSVGYAFDTKKLYLWNGTSWVDEGLSPLDLAKAYADANKIFKPVVGTNADFNTYKEYGSYYWTSGATWDSSPNKPPFNNQWAYMLVMPISSSVVAQYVWAFNTKKIAYRFSNALGVWSTWSIFSDDDTLTNAITLAVQNWSNLNKIFKPVVGTNADFNTYKEYGSYYWTSGATWDSSPNKPPFNNQWAFMFVLPISTTVVAQFVFCLNSQALAYRWCNLSNTWSAWITYGGDASVLAAANNQLDANLGAKIRANTTPIFKPGSKNLFDSSVLLNGYRITGSGALEVNSGASTTALIRIIDASSITISGLQASSGAYRAIRFLSKDQAVLGVTSIAPDATSRTFSGAAGTYWIQVTLKDGSDTWALDTSTIQIELSSTATAYAPYLRGNLTSLYGVDIEAISGGGGNGGIVSKAIGASYLLFGDSITQSSPVDSGIFDQTTSPFPNWPTYAKDQLKMSKFRNYAKSGASFRNKNLEPLQFLRNQVELAITNGETADVIVVACGTNDGISSLGTYEAAMAKTTLESLDQTICMEAARWIFWKLRIQYPDAICFFCNPLQRASNTVEELAPMVDGLSKMAQRHGFILIDQNKESGIIRELEVLNGVGKYLADGLHPNTEGRMRQANLIVSKIVSYMSY